MTVGQHFSSNKKKKKTYQLRIVCPAKISFKEKGKIKTLTQTETERIHQQQSCTIRNAEVSPSGRRKMIPHGNLDLYRRMKRLRIIKM